ncbi:MAG: ABC transporter permease [Candidatus Stygibacter australis]|nr:ABC transporter permease [Candidatus Stygibacter australis]MDP8323288.1 ABC transporter permease [Candidatus Stygibacter australis]
MFKQNILQAFRVLKKDKFHSFLNIIGLALGLCCSILVLLFVQNELSYDMHHENIDRIYRYGVNMTIGDNNSTQPICNAAVGPLLQNEMPEIEAYMRCFYPGQLLVNGNDKTLYESSMLMTDNSIFQIFSHPFIYGNRSEALERANTIVLTEKTAKKYFEDQNPVGEELEIDNEIYEITGVIENLPENSHLKFSALMSLNSYLQTQNLEDIYTPRALGGNMMFFTYFLFSKNFTAEQFSKKFQNFYNREMVENDRINYIAVVEPVEDIYLNSTIDKRYSQANRRFLYGFASIGLFILILVCINYVNMATSRAGSRAREIGMKKVLGAQKKQLIRQFLSEAVILSFLALVIGFVLANLILMLTPFNELINKSLQINLLNNPILLGSSFLITIFVGLISGFYPAFYLSHLAPISSLKGYMKKGKAGSFFRNALVSFQFIISITAVILTLFMHQQIDFMQSFDLGFDQENVLTISATNEEILKNFKNYREMIIDHHGVVSAGFSDSPIGKGFTGYAFNWEAESGEMEIHATRQLYADKNYLETMGIPIVAGRNFTKERNLDDPSIDFIVNEAMIELFGWENPIGKRNQYGQVIGVMKDFSFASARNEIIPLYILQPRNPLGVLNIRLKGENISETMTFIKQKWQEFAPGFPINYSFLEQDLNTIYASDVIQKKLSSIFTYFCILISCFGLFGLTSYSTLQRTKEVAVRKILGSSVLQIIVTLFKGIFTTIVVSAILAGPLAYFVFSLWQKNYANKVSVNPLIFGLAFLGALLVSFLTSAYHTIKVANTNPVEALKYE